MLERLNESKTPAEMREAIFELENAIIASGMNVAHELEVVHHFAPGVYMRELRIPAGMILTGAIHKTEHLNILSQGEIVVWTEEGMRRLTASTVIKSKPGMKRTGATVTDSIWITVHHNPENIQDTDELWDMLVTNDKAMLDSLVKEKIEGA